MPPRKDYTGIKVNALTFLEFAEIRNKTTFWRFRCDCGNEVIASARTIMENKKHSCGCMRRKGRQTAANAIHRRYMKGAKSRGHSFLLTKGDVTDLVFGPCFYCGAEASNLFVNDHTGEEFSYNGIDRVNNSFGYEMWNVVTCCSSCNWSKKDMSGHDFIEWARRIVIYQNNKQESDFAHSLFRLEVAK